MLQSSGLLCLSNVIANYVLAYVVAADSFSLCNVVLCEYNTSYFFQIPTDTYLDCFQSLLPPTPPPININLSPNGVQLLQSWGHGICWNLFSFQVYDAKLFFGG